MVKIADIGTFESIPQVVAHLLTSDSAALDAHLAGGWDIDASQELTNRMRYPAITLALAVGAAGSVRWLVEHGADLNLPDEPAFANAARYSDPDTLRYLAANGADVDARIPVGGDAYSQALILPRLENLPVIQELGHTVADHGGKAFRSAVMRRLHPAVEFFLAHGVDIDYHEADMVHPYQPTALWVAAYHRDADMCRLLVERGANVTIPTKDGSRPYTVAVEQGDDDLAAYFKALEPPEFHDLQNKLLELKPCNLPTSLVEFLQRDQLRVDLDGSPYDIDFIEFLALTDTVLMKAGRKKVLRLSREVDNYSSMVLVWNPKTKRMGYWDAEHEEHGDIATFEDFMLDPANHMQRVVEGRYAPTAERSNR